jgi:hypothetical protein
MDGWFYTAFGSEFGPFTFDELIQHAKSGQLSANDMVKLGVSGKLRKAGSIGRLVAHFPFQLANSRNLDLLTTDAPVLPHPSPLNPTGSSIVHELPAVSHRADSGHASGNATKRADSQLPANEATVWWSRVDGLEYGPVDEATVREWISNGQLDENDELRKNADVTYALASTYREFFTPKPQAADLRREPRVRISAPPPRSGPVQERDFTSNVTKGQTALATNLDIPNVPSGETIDRRPDHDLLREIADRIASKNIASFSRIGLDIQHGIITVQGDVASEGERLLLIHLLQQTDGLVQINDGLNVKGSKAAALPQARTVTSSPKPTAPKFDFSGFSRVFESLKTIHLVIAAASVLVMGSAALVVHASSSRGHVAVYPTKGSITLDGKPMPEATVIFTPAIRSDRLKGIYIRGVVNSDGNFDVGTYKEADGAPAGEFVVTVIWCKREQKDGETSFGPNLAPAVYARPETSKLKVTIKKGKNELAPFELQSPRAQEK